LPHANLDGAQQLVLDGDYAYVAAWDARRMTIVEIGGGLEGAPCTPGEEGTVVYNESSAVHQFCNGTHWRAMGRAEQSHGLVGHWRLDETSGTTVFDAAGSVNGTMEGGLDAGNDSVAGMVGRALQFDGNDDTINFGNPAGVFDFGTSQSFTLAAWIRPDVISGQSRIISRGHWDWQSGFALWRYGQEIMVGTAGGSEAASVLPVTGIITSAGNWYHVAAVFDQSAKTVQVYVNGVARNLTAMPGTCGSGGSTVFDYSACPLSTATNSQPFHIGSNHENNAENHEGAIDDVRIYNRALSEADIVQLYNAGGEECENPAGDPGMMLYNTAHAVMQYCDGSAWRAIGKSQ